MNPQTFPVVTYIRHSSLLYGFTPCPCWKIHLHQLYKVSCEKEWHFLFKFISYQCSILLSYFQACCWFFLTMRTLVWEELLFHWVGFSFDFSAEFAVNKKRKRKKNFLLFFILPSVFYHSKLCRGKKILLLWVCLFICFILLCFSFSFWKDTKIIPFICSVSFHVLLLIECI